MMFDDYLLLFILRVFWQNHVDGNANIVLSFWKAVRLTKDNILGRFVSIIMIQIFIRPIAKLRHVRLLLLEFRRQSGNMSFLGHVQEGVASEKWSQWSYLRAVDIVASSSGEGLMTSEACDDFFVVTENGLWPSSTPTPLRFAVVCYIFPSVFLDRRNARIVVNR